MNHTAAMNVITIRRPLILLKVHLPLGRTIPKWTSPSKVQ
jgi:hypothetical protein